MARRTSTHRADLDGPWKEVLQRLFPDFLAFVAADVHQAIDWKQKVDFQPQELRKILPSSRSSKGIVDLLARVHLRSGGGAWVYCHVEAQAFPKRDFAERMFRTHVRLFEKERRPIFSLALLLDRSPGFRPDSFENHVFGTGCLFRFRAVKLLDFRDRIDELRASSNPFAHVVRTHLEVLAARTDQGRLESKRALIRELFRSGFERTVIDNVFRFIDWILRLPQDLQERLEAEVKDMRGEKVEIYLTKWERDGLERGRREDVLRILEVRFGPVPKALTRAVEAVTDQNHLARLIDAAALAGDLATFSKALQGKARAGPRGRGPIGSGRGPRRPAARSRLGPRGGTRSREK